MCLWSICASATSVVASLNPCLLSLITPISRYPDKQQLVMGTGAHMSSHAACVALSAESLPRVPRSRPAGPPRAVQCMPDSLRCQLRQQVPQLPEHMHRPASSKRLANVNLYKFRQQSLRKPEGMHWHVSSRLSVATGSMLVIILEHIRNREQSYQHERNGSCDSLSLARQL